MKRFLLILPVLTLAACAGQHQAPTTTSASYPDDALPQGSREPSHVHTYQVNDYIDPNNPRVLHRGHAVEVVEQDERWNLDSTSAPDDEGNNAGPVTSADQPNAAPNPYTAEFEAELSEQRDQSKQLAAMGAQMTGEMARLENFAEKQADAVAENATFRARLEDLQREIDELKPPRTSPINPNAPKTPSWWESIFDLFLQLPDGAPIAAEKPAFQTNITIQPVPPPAAPTNAADEIPSPGDMAAPHVFETNTP